MQSSIDIVFSTRLSHTVFAMQSLARGINLVLKLYTMHHANKFLMYLHASENVTFSPRADYEIPWVFIASLLALFSSSAPCELSHRNNSRPLFSHLSRPVPAPFLAWKIVAFEWWSFFGKWERGNYLNWS